MPSSTGHLRRHSVSAGRLRLEVWAVKQRKRVLALRINAHDPGRRPAGVVSNRMNSTMRRRRRSGQAAEPGVDSQHHPNHSVPAYASYGLGTGPLPSPDASFTIDGPRQPSVVAPVRGAQVRRYAGPEASAARCGPLAPFAVHFLRAFTTRDQGIFRYRAVLRGPPALPAPRPQCR